MSDIFALTHSESWQQALDNFSELSEGSTSLAFKKMLILFKLTSHLLDYSFDNMYFADTSHIRLAICWFDRLVFFQSSVVISPIDEDRYLVELFICQNKSFEVTFEQQVALKESVPLLTSLMERIKPPG